MQASQALAPPAKWLRAHAASERLSRELGAMSERYMRVLQPTADALGHALGLPKEATGIFGEEVVRGSSAAPLAQLAAVLAPKLRQVAGLGSWQIISPGRGEGSADLGHAISMQPASHSILAHECQMKC